METHTLQGKKRSKKTGPWREQRKRARRACEVIVLSSLRSVPLFRWRIFSIIGRTASFGNLGWRKAFGLEVRILQEGTATAAV